MKKLCTVYINGAEKKVLIVYPSGAIMILPIEQWEKRDWQKEVTE